MQQLQVHRLHFTASRKCSNIRTGCDSCVLCHSAVPRWLQTGDSDAPANDCHRLSQCMNNGLSVCCRGRQQ